MHKWSIAPGLVAVVLGVFAGQAMAALPRTYDVQRIDSPDPQPSGLFGIGLIGHSDLNGDGEDDVLVPQTSTGPNNDGQIFIFSGATGALIDTINAPDAGNPTNAPQRNNRAGFGLFTSTIADLASCPGGSAGANCPAPSATGDGVDEIVTGATGIDVPTPGAPNGLAVDSGRAYVFDGRTRALLRRIDMPAADRVQHASVPGPSNPHTPNFGRTVLAPAGLPPCAGNAGIGPCIELPRSVAIGDVDGAFDADANDVADLVIGAPSFDETAATNPDCDPGPCHEAGRSYIYRGEDIIAGPPAQPLEVPIRTLKSVVAQTDDEVSSAQTHLELFGQAVFPIGDVGRCNAATVPAGELCPNVSSTNVPDGSPEVVISAFRTDLPSNADFPDPAFFDVGVNMLVDGRTGTLLAIYEHPEPQAGAIFGFTLHNEPAPGDLGSTLLPDVLVPAMRQNHDFTAQGRVYVMNGNFKAGANGINFAQLNDPTPQSGGNFGVSSAGVGDLVSDAEGAPRNEVLIGAFGPHNPGTNERVINDISFFNAVTERRLQTISDPDQQEGSSFGTALAPIGDVNDDGFLDIAVSADLWDADPTISGRNHGRVYILRSDNSPAPTPDATPSPTSPPGRAAYPLVVTPTAAPFADCPALSANIIRGSAAGDRITGTARGDRIFGGAGDDVVDALAGADCIDLGPGADTGEGGLGADLIVGGLGVDRMSGSAGNDRMRGGPDADRLNGGFGDDRLHGQAGRDRIKGSRGRERINGGSANDVISAGSSSDRVAGDQGSDRINGNSGDDVLKGNSGRDRISGSTGLDRISGGGGNDRIGARDGRRDRIDCGRGDDRVVADRFDGVARNCERVSRR